MPDRSVGNLTLRAAVWLFLIGLTGTAMAFELKPHWSMMIGTLMATMPQRFFKED